MLSVKAVVDNLGLPETAVANLTQRRSSIVAALEKPARWWWNRMSETDGTNRRFSALRNSVGCSGYKQTMCGHRGPVEDDPEPKSLVGSPLDAVASGPPKLATKRRAGGRPPALKIPVEQSPRSLMLGEYDVLTSVAIISSLAALRDA